MPGSAIGAVGLDHPETFHGVVVAVDGKGCGLVLRLVAVDFPIDRPGNLFGLDDLDDIVDDAINSGGIDIFGSAELTEINAVSVLSERSGLGEIHGEKI